MTFIIAIFQFHCKKEHKQVKWDKIKRVICKSDRGMFIIYKVVDYLNDFWNLFLDKVYLKNEWLSGGKFHSVNFRKNWAHLAEKNLRPGAKITAVFRLSWKYFSSVKAIF